jgi:hypothetical protein
VLVETLAGDHEAAEHEARAAYAVLREMGDRIYQASEANLVGEALAAQGRVDEAEQWLAIAHQPGGPADWGELVLQARIMLHRGLLGDAETLARAALEQGGEIPVPISADPRFTLAEILASSGRNDEARYEAEQCLRRYEVKGIVPLTEKARALLADIPIEG